MDKKRVEDIIYEWVGYDSFGLDGVSVRDAAHAIVAQDEQETARLQAQVAVMSQVPKRFFEWLHPYEGGEWVIPDNIKAMRQQLEDLVATTPEVLWSGKGRIRHFVHKTAIEMAHTGTPLYLKRKLKTSDGQQVTVYVVAEVVNDG